MCCKYTPPKDKFKKPGGKGRRPTRYDQHKLEHLEKEQQYYKLKEARVRQQQRLAYLRSLNPLLSEAEKASYRKQAMSTMLEGDEGLQAVGETPETPAAEKPAFTPAHVPKKGSIDQQLALATAAAGGAPHPHLATATHQQEPADDAPEEEKRAYEAYLQKLQAEQAFHGKIASARRHSESVRAARHLQRTWRAHDQRQTLRASAHQKKRAEGGAKAFSTYRDLSLAENYLEFSYPPDAKGKPRKSTMGALKGKAAVTRLHLAEVDEVVLDEKDAQVWGLKMKDGSQFDFKVSNAKARGTWVMSVKQKLAEIRDPRLKAQRDPGASLMQAAAAMAVGQAPSPSPPPSPPEEMV
jgi:hypothetical protein